MSESNRSRPGVEFLLLGLVVAGGLFAWLSRGSMPKSERAPAAKPAPATTDGPGWTAHESRPRRRIPFTAEVTAREKQLCVDMAQAQIGFALHDTVTAEITDAYAVGDPETGAGDSIIFEGIARRPGGEISDFRCSASNLGSYSGGPFITHRERP